MDQTKQNSEAGYLELLLQFLPQRVQLVQTLTQVDVGVKLDERSDEI